MGKAVSRAVTKAARKQQQGGGNGTSGGWMPRPGMRTSGSHPQSTSKPLLDDPGGEQGYLEATDVPQPEARLATIAVRDRGSHSCQPNYEIITELSDFRRET